MKTCEYCGAKQVYTEANPFGIGKGTDKCMNCGRASKKSMTGGKGQSLYPD